MNKIVIPITLVSIILIAGVFAFSPVEKASTVHGTLATSAQVDGQDMTVPFVINFTYATAAQTLGLTIVPAQTGVTYSGNYFLSAVPDHVTASGNIGPTSGFECGLMDTSGSANTNGQVVSGTNATTGTPSSGVLTNLGSGDGIVLAINTADLVDTTNFGGVCQGVIFLDENSG